MKLIINILLVLILNTKVIAQNSSTFEWAKSVDGIASNYGNDIVVDPQGNSYIIGSYSETASFGNFNLTSMGVSDVFIAKIDALGNFIWVKSIGGTGGDDGNGIALDNQGNIYITGNYRGDVTFGNTILTSFGFSVGIFTAKLDASGNFIWAKGADGSGSHNGKSIAVDSQGNCFITGTLAGTANFDTISVSGGVFIAKLNSQGSFEWVKTTNPNVFTEGNSITCDNQGNCYITGRFEGTTNFDSTSLSANSGYEMYIGKIDASGNYLWITKAGGNNSEGEKITIDNFGNLYVTGYFKGGGSFGNFTLSSVGFYVNGFATKLDSSGNFIWATRLAGSNSGSGTGEGISTDFQGNSFIVGNFSGSTLLGSTFLSSQGSDDIYIAKLDTMGDIEWAKSAGGGSNDRVNSISTDSHGNSFLIGNIINDAYFDSIYLTVAGSNNIFIAKIRNNLSNSSEFKEFVNLKVYPNPTKNFINIDLNQNIGKVNISITDLYGKTVFNQDFEKMTNEIINLENLANGIYTLRILDAEFNNYNFKIIKN